MAFQTISHHNFLFIMHFFLPILHALWFDLFCKFQPFRTFSIQIISFPSECNRFECFECHFIWFEMNRNKIRKIEWKAAKKAWQRNRNVLRVRRGRESKCVLISSGVGFYALVVPLQLLPSMVIFLIFLARAVLSHYRLHPKTWRWRQCTRIFRVDDLRDCEIDAEIGGFFFIHFLGLRETISTPQPIRQSQFFVRSQLNSSAMQHREVCRWMRTLFVISFFFLTFSLSRSLALVFFNLL